MIRQGSLLRGSSRFTNARALAVASLLVLAGCGGGGGGTAATAPQPPVPLPSATPAAPQEVGKATLTIAIPRAAPASSARAPRYVSPNSAAVQVTINSVDGSTTLPAGVPRTTVVQLSSAPGGNCTASGGGETCTIGIIAPAGQVSYTFTLLDNASPTPHQLAVKTATYTIPAGPRASNSSLQAQLNGIVASVTIVPPTFAAGTSYSGPLTVTAYDASGAAITGPAPYAAPFTLTDGDGSGHTSLTAHGQTGSTAPVGAPGDVVIINYDGQVNDGFTITSSGGTLPPEGGGHADVPPANSPHGITLTGTTNGDAAHGVKPSDPNYNKPTLFFVRPGQSESFTADQTGYSEHHGFTLTLDPASCGSGANAVVLPPQTTDSKTFTITATAHSGICKATLAGGPSATLRPSTSTSAPPARRSS